MESQNWEERWWNRASQWRMMDLYPLPRHLSRKTPNTKVVPDDPRGCQYQMVARYVAAGNSGRSRSLLIRASFQHGAPTAQTACSVEHQCCLQLTSTAVLLGRLCAACPKGWGGCSRAASSWRQHTQTQSLTSLKQQTSGGEEVHCSQELA